MLPAFTMWSWEGVWCCAKRLRPGCATTAVCTLLSSLPQCTLLHEYDHGSHHLLQPTLVHTYRQIRSAPKQTQNGLWRSVVGVGLSGRWHSTWLCSGWQAWQVLWKRWSRFCLHVCVRDVVWQYGSDLGMQCTSTPTSGIAANCFFEIRGACFAPKRACSRCLLWSSQTHDECSLGIVQYFAIPPAVTGNS